MSRLLIRQIVGWLFFGGFVFLIGVGVWAVVTIQRMKREQVTAMGMLRALAGQAELKTAMAEFKAGVESVKQTSHGMVKET